LRNRKGSGERRTSQLVLFRRELQPVSLATIVPYIQSIVSLVNVSRLCTGNPFHVQSFTMDEEERQELEELRQFKRNQELVQDAIVEGIYVVDVSL